jgi:hypothetical protein
MLKEAIDLIGPVWPLIFIVAVFQGALFLFGLISLKFYPEEDRDPERSFLRSLDKANTALSSIAVMAGFLGTYLGLLQSLPELKNVILGEGAQAAARIITGMQQAFGSSVAGLIVGGMAGSLNEFVLHLLFPDDSNSAPRSSGFPQLRHWLQKLLGNRHLSNNGQRHVATKVTTNEEEERRGPR